MEYFIDWILERVQDDGGGIVGCRFLPPAGGLAGMTSSLVLLLDSWGILISVLRSIYEG